jgi:Fic family protein
VPPSPLILNEFLDKWINYLNDDVDNVLIQAAVIFAQFEILHPFKDGNGRIGRLLVPLFLCQKGVLNSPTLYLSDYLDQYRDENNSRLRDISTNGNWQSWIEFFLNALIFQAEENSDKAKRILALYESLKSQFQTATRSQYALSSLDAFFSMPIINATQFKELAGIEKRATSNAILKQLEETELVKKLSPGSGQQPAVYCLPNLLVITE